ncbi:hypothetical protein [Ruicaihuangia caeni]|uniref:Uncharacterized protein n=1 Tax=Ruicaihuangia caeni TaxID=3042517 RepID=A0AAW6TD04_9MICO|nr:hypothetical protein [Klugiella sp. YN-L-19]MDI2099462.1 hypothetical protein [Klugiella sp. YN-L-19]
MKSAPASPLLYLLVTVLFAEAALLAGATVFLVVELLIDRPESYASAIALMVLTGAAAAWVTSLALGALRRRSWVRGPALVWQVLQLAVAIGSFQGADARFDIGWALLVPALLGAGLLFTKPVIAATARASLEPGALGEGAEPERDSDADGPTPLR